VAPSRDYEDVIRIACGESQLIDIRAVGNKMYIALEQCGFKELFPVKKSLLDGTFTF
jgi:hypothetical protein